MHPHNEKENVETENNTKTSVLIGGNTNKLIASDVLHPDFITLCQQTAWRTSSHRQDESYSWAGQQPSVSIHQYDSGKKKSTYTGKHFMLGSSNKDVMCSTAATSVNQIYNATRWRFPLRPLQMLTVDTPVYPLLQAAQLLHRFITRYSHNDNSSRFLAVISNRVSVLWPTFGFGGEFFCPFGRQRSCTNANVTANFANYWLLPTWDGRQMQL